MKQLWIFRVAGGEPFRLQVDGSPPMNYDGKAQAILRTLCTRKQALLLEAEMGTFGCVVEANCPQETEDQKTERKNIMQVLGGNRVFPCVQCPACAWFDPHLESLCGAGFGDGEGWDDAAIQGSMTNKKFQEDFEGCPRREAQIQ